MSFTINVNGVAHEVDVEPETPLLWVLRDTLGLTGTKYGCGIAECSSCAVHVDGSVSKSCNITAASVVGKNVTTIEGLSEDGSHPVQQAWIEHTVAQCGYCQSGQIMQASALLERSPNPSDAEIATAMNDNLCRCGTYKAIHAAIRSVADARQI